MLHFLCLIVNRVRTWVHMVSGGNGMTELKPCPNCGNPIIGINTRNYKYQVICSDCGFSTPICFRDYDKAIGLWNNNKLRIDRNDRMH